MSIDNTRGYEFMIGSLEAALASLDKIATREWNGPEVFALNRHTQVCELIEEIKRHNEFKCWKCKTKIDHDPAEHAFCKSCGAEL